MGSHRGGWSVGIHRGGWYVDSYRGGVMSVGSQRGGWCLWALTGEGGTTPKICIYYFTYF